MTALVRQDGIEMASQSGRSPSPYSRDEAFGASNTIRQMDNPVAARLKCEVVGRDTPAVPAGSPTGCRRTWDRGSDTATGKVAHDTLCRPAILPLWASSNVEIAWPGHGWTTLHV